ncbi:MAG: dihydrodipicolinate synthase family protein [SAR324 cluster bacterium]|nr:dihydrodipicolinate synthase family protein [SAR324 cluster bacterium]
MPDSNSSLRGVFTAALTPFTETLTPDLSRLADHTNWLLESGCDGVALLGSTGEANSLTGPQRESVIKLAGTRLPPEKLMIGTGSCSFQDAVRQTQLAVDHGIFTVLVLPPFYYKPVSDEALFRFFADLVNAVNEPRLRIVFYHFPQLTGVPFSLDLLKRLKQEVGAVAAGIKDSSGKWENMSAVCKEVPDFAVFAGTEKFLLDILEIGGAGCITATGNALAPGCKTVYSAWTAGEVGTAQAEQEKLTAQRLAIQEHPLASALKGIFAQRRGDAAWNRMLPPFLPLAEDTAKALVTKLESLGAELP